MNYIRKGMSFGYFVKHIKTALIVAFVLIGFLLFIGSLIQDNIRSDRINEQNLYWALQGKAVEDKEAIKTAEMARKIHKDGVTITSVESWKQFKKLMWENEEADSRAPNSLRFAFNHWDRVVSILENPETEIPIRIPAWSSWLKLMGLISWIILALCLSIGYVVVTDDRNDKFWRYPWDKFWAWLMIPIMLPYIFFVQSGTGIYFLVRQINRADALNQKQNLEQLISTVQSPAAMEHSRQAWIHLQNKELKLEEKALEMEIEKRRAYLVNLGKDLEKEQRDLALARTALKELNETAKTSPTRKTHEEAGQEFDKLFRLPELQAVKVSGEEIRLYTNRIRILQGGGRIDNFLISIGTGALNKRYVKIEHILSGKEIKFCFGRYADIIEENLKWRNYIPVIVYILKAIQPEKEELLDEVLRI